jgi:hypothetical protein
MGTLMIDPRRTEEKAPTEWAEEIVKRLRKAFELARQAQIQTSKANKERDTRKFTNPVFRPGDHVFLWESSSEQTRIQRDIESVQGHKGRLPTKLTNKWTGPFPVVRMDGTRYCVISKNGTEVRHNVNRLIKEHTWSEHHTDTMRAFEKLEAKERPESKDRRIKTGEIVVFPKNMTDDDPLPFGVGRILDDTNQNDLQFQWMCNPTYTPRGTFLLGWVSPRDRKFYYKSKPLHPSHPRFCGEDCGVSIGNEDVIVHGFSVLNEKGKLSKETKEVIAGNQWVKQAWGRDTRLLFVPNEIP